MLTQKYRLKTIKIKIKIKIYKKVTKIYQKNKIYFII